MFGLWQDRLTHWIRFGFAGREALERRDPGQDHGSLDQHPLSISCGDPRSGDQRGDPIFEAPLLDSNGGAPGAASRLRLRRAVGMAGAHKARRSPISPTLE